MVGSRPDETQRRGRAAIRITRVSKGAVIATVAVALLAGVAAAAVLDPFRGDRPSAAGPSVDARAVTRLDAQRTALRERLSGSETPQEQAASATELADSYGRAADAVESPGLASAARAGERAYDELSAAAEAGSADRFAAASDEVERADARLASLADGSR